MNRLKITSLLFLSVLLLTYPTVLPTVAQTFCNTDGDYEPPSSTYKTITLENQGITIDIPDNYRAMKKSDGSIEILHPDDYQWLQCLAQGGRGGHGYYSETIRFVPDEPNLTLREQAIKHLSDYQIDADGNHYPVTYDIFPYENNGIEGYIVTSISGYSVRFLGKIPNQSQHLIVSAGCDCNVALEDLTNLLNRIKLIEND